VLNKHRELVYGLRKRVLEENTDLKEFLLSRGMEEKEYKAKEKEVGADFLRQIIRWVSLQVIDNYWMDHLTALEDLRQGIGLRGYAQRDPLIEYKREAYAMFQSLISNIDNEIVEKVILVQVKKTEPVEKKTALQAAAEKATYQEASAVSARQLATGNTRQPAKARPVVNATKTVGRNDPCPCGSGKKYKKCGLINAPEHRG
jgi:preprotein translocase subunit SecA